MDSATGWGRTNESLRILNEKNTPETNQFLKDSGLRCYPNGDLHHPHLSFTDQTYDGRYAYANDKANNRVCRVRLDFMKTEQNHRNPLRFQCTRSASATLSENRLRLCQRRTHRTGKRRGQFWNDAKTWNAVYTRHRRRNHGHRMASIGGRQRTTAMPTTKANTPSPPATTPNAP